MAAVASVDETGVVVPDYAAALEYLKTEYRRIYGDDVYLEPDSQDGQLLAIFALALTDVNSAVAAVYNSFSPATALKEGLSRVVKINGLRRAVSSFSSVDLKLVGQVGSTITNGVARDVLNQRWLLPASVTIPVAGEIVVTAVAELEGAVQALPGTVTTIATPTRGWQSVTNLAVSDPGDPVESDAALRRRQARSTALPSQSILEGLEGVLASLEGVSRLRLYENDTNATDGDGVPGNSIAVVIEGGDATAIAEAIFRRKTPGTGTFGTTTIQVLDSSGVPRPIRFSRPVSVPIDAEIELTPLTGYTSVVGEDISSAVATSLSSLGIGKSALVSKLASVANLPGDDRGGSFDITSIKIRKGVDPFAASNITIAWNEVATSSAADVEIITP